MFLKKQTISAAMSAAVAILLLVPSCKPDPDAAVRQRLDSMFTSMYPADGPGGAVLVLKGDNVFFSKGYGIADMKTGAKIDCNTFFNIASMSKQFTGVAIMQLVEKGLISLDDNVRKFHPEYKSAIWDSITVRHLLTHSSGVPDIRSEIFTLEQRIYAGDSLAISYFVDLDSLNFRPGTSYEYINPTFTLLGNIVEIVSGMTFDEYMRENVFTPAGMEHTLYFNASGEDTIPNMAHAYQFDTTDGIWHEKDGGEDTFFATKPDGGIYTSVNEFMAWEKALRSCTVLSEESIKAAQTGYNHYQDDPCREYGYGWIVENGGHAIFHTGGNGAFRTIGIRYPEANAMVVVFSNRNDFKWFEIKENIEKILSL